jgi:hypothetical protein
VTGRGVAVLLAGPHADRHTDAGQLNAPGRHQRQLVLERALHPGGEPLTHAVQQPAGDPEVQDRLVGLGQLGRENAMN